MLNEYVLKLKCSHCEKTRNAVFPCAGSLAVMKAGLKTPTKCGCDKGRWTRSGVLDVDLDEINKQIKKIKKK